MIDLAAWEARFAAFIREQGTAVDAGHDFDHTYRVVQTAKKLAAGEHARLEVVAPAAWLHDCVTVPKNSPERRLASQKAAEVAGQFLAAAGYPSALIPEIEHAITAHSYSAQVAPQTIEAKVVQDADRLDAIGAIGIARCLLIGAGFGIPLYHTDEPFPQQRPPEDKRYIIDHFYTKLFRLVEMMQTAAGRAEAERRTQFMRTYLQQLAAEIGSVS